MWRFLLAGLVTVCGLLLLFVASFGNPHTTFADIRSMLPVIQTRSAVTSPPALAPPQAVQVTPVPAPSPAPAAISRPDEAALQEQRDELQRQVRGLQAKVAEDTQAMTTLRSEADATRHDLDDLRQQRSADQAASDHLKQAEQRQLDASEQRTADAEKKVAAEQAALDRLKSTADLAKPPANAPDNVKSAPVARPTPPIASANLASNVPPVRKPDPVSAKPVQTTPDLPDAVLNRLRRESHSRAMMRPDAANTHQVETVSQVPAPPPERLADARAALASGHLDEARQLLEQAQVQLVLRPVGPSNDASGARSVAAGQVAEALSMLGGGDVPHAMQYIDLAIAQRGRGQSGVSQTVNPVTPARGNDQSLLGSVYLPDERYSQSMSDH